MQSMETKKTPWRTRALSVVLSAALAVTLCPAAALAAEPATEPEADIAEPMAIEATVAEEAVAAEAAIDEAAVVAEETVTVANAALAASVPAAQADEPVTPPAGETTTPPATDQTPGASDTTTSDNTNQKPAVVVKKPVISFRTLGKIPGVTAKYQKKGVVTGKTVSTKPLTYIKIKNDSKNIKGNIKYKVYMAGKGWTSWKTNGQKAGNGKTKNAVQGIKITLTGDLGKKYNVYYRAYVVGYGWTGWGTNSDQVGAPKVSAIRAYQVRIVAKSSKATVKKYKQKHKNLKVATGSEQTIKYQMAAKAQNQTSSTKWLILVDTHKNRVCVLKGKKGQWNVYKFFKCSCGAPGTPTVRGKFTIGNRGRSFGEDKGYSCWYWTQFHGNYLFHSVLYNPGSQRSLQDGRLGMNLSHGCVRLAIGNAKWINRNIPRGTKVWTY